MTPAARIQAAIECLDQIIIAAEQGGAAADTLIQRYFAARRYAGSKDRRAVRDLIYDVIRSTGEVPPTGRAALIGHARIHAPDLLASFGAGGHGPAALVHGEPAGKAGLAPLWLGPRLKRRFGADLAGADALLSRARLDLRVNRLKASREEVMAQHPELVPTMRAPMGLSAPVGIDIEALAASQAGALDVQDEGSQLAALALAAAPGERIVDLCAGAGGKTLALAADMDNQGLLVACDIDRGRLTAMAPRLVRAGVTIADVREMNPRREMEHLADIAGTMDAVLVDAPCSGSGTWRRNPESRWRLTPKRLERLMEEQDRLLDIAASLLRPGGRLVFVTCSVLMEEGEDRIAAFHAHHPEFAPLPMCIPGDDAPVTARVLLPGAEGCDGFFIASARLTC